MLDPEGSPSGSLELSSLTPSYCARCYGTIRPWRQLQRDLERFVEWAAERGKLLPQHVLTSDVREYIYSRPLGPASRYRIRQNLLEFWDWLMDEGFAPWNPCYRVKVKSPSSNARA